MVLLRRVVAYICFFIEVHNAYTLVAFLACLVGILDLSRSLLRHSYNQVVMLGNVDVVIETHCGSRFSKVVKSVPCGRGYN